MRFMRRGVLGVGLGLLACGSEPGGSDDAYFGTTGYVRDCHFATDAVGESEVTPLGVSPADVTGWLEGDHRLRIEYNPEGLRLLGVEPGMSEVSIDVQSRGRAGWVDRYAPPPSDRDTYCNDGLIIDTHLNLSTADGQLGHEMDLSFVIEEPERAVASVLISTDAFHGALREYPPSPERPESEMWLWLSLEITPSGTSGTVTYFTRHALIDSVVAAFPGTMVCSPGYMPMEGAEYAALRSQAVAALDAASPVSLQSTEASLELTFEDRGEPGCVLPREKGDTSIEFAGDVVLRSSDGAIDGRMEVLLDADFAGPDLFASRATRSLYFGDAEEAAAQTADIISEPLDFGVYADDRLEFQQRVTAAGDSEGLLRAFGVVAQSCAFGAPVESCSRDIELFGARWSDASAP